MRISNDNSFVTITGEWYSLIFDNTKPEYVSLLVEGAPFARLFAISAADTLENVDESFKVGKWQIASSKNKALLRLRSSSTLWLEKEYVFECTDNNIAYYYTIKGKGCLDNARFFEGFLHGAGKLARFNLKPDHRRDSVTKARPLKDLMQSSEYSFTTVFNPEPNRLFKQYLNPFETADINVLNDRVADLGGNWFFTPSPFCYAMKSQDFWVGIGLAAKKSECNFTGFSYTGGRQFGFCLPYQGYTNTNGKWTSPSVIFTKSMDEYGAIGSYIEWLKEHKYFKVYNRDIAAWWRKPILCGWGEQCHQNMLASGRNAQQYANQGNYEAIIRKATEKKLQYGTLIIDDKWQDKYGINRADIGKWPNLRGFIDRNLEFGVRTLLWFKTWDFEGVPVEECIVNEKEEAVAVDPTNPKYRKRLQEQMRYMLSSEKGCLNAFGLKIDFTAETPNGAGKKLYKEGAWGVELLRSLLKVIYDAAKRVKDDSLIITHTPNPYFYDISDMIRLNDICSDFASVKETMLHRAKVVRLMSSRWLIDCDNWPMPNLEAWREYMRFQPEIGVPSLYAVSGLDIPCCPFAPKDYEIIRKAWRAYSIKKNHLVDK